MRRIACISWASLPLNEKCAWCDAPNVRFRVRGKRAAELDDKTTLAELAEAAAPSTPPRARVDLARITPRKLRDIGESFIHQSARMREMQGGRVEVNVRRLQQAVLADAGCGPATAAKIGFAQFGAAYHTSKRRQHPGDGINFKLLPSAGGRPRLFTDSELRDLLAGHLSSTCR